MLKGIDISNHQKGFVIPKNLDFVIVKATEELNFVDAYCNGFVNQIKANKQLYGFYHFAGGNNPEHEANFFINNTKNYFNDGIPVLDYELANPAPYGIKPSEWVERFCKLIYDKMHVYPVVYCSALAYPFNVSNVASNWTAKNCGLWLAGYPDNRTTWRNDTPPYDIKPWSNVAIWQFTSNLAINGYNVDGDLAYMDKNAWLKYAKAKTTEKDEPVNTEAFNVWNYRNKKLETVDTYQILRDTRDMCKQILKEIAALELEITELKSKLATK